MLYNGASQRQVVSDCRQPPGAQLLCYSPFQLNLSWRGRKPQYAANQLVQKLYPNVPQNADHGVQALLGKVPDHERPPGRRSPVAPHGGAKGEPAMEVPARGRGSESTHLINDPLTAEWLFSGSFGRASNKLDHECCPQLPSSSAWTAD